eukprot:scaffold429_cov321-Prasinococcus_capsulatus_cf.AAC.3
MGPQSRVPSCRGQHAVAYPRYRGMPSERASTCGWSRTAGHPSAQTATAVSAVKRRSALATAVGGWMTSH